MVCAARETDSNSGSPESSVRQARPAASSIWPAAAGRAAICAEMSAANESRTSSRENLSKLSSPVSELEAVDALLELARQGGQLSRELERLVRPLLGAARDLRDLLHDGGDAHRAVDLGLRNGADVGD